LRYRLAESIGKATPSTTFAQLLPNSHDEVPMNDMSEFMPHGMCFLWRRDILTLHVAADALIALSYFASRCCC
jgi:hypothetical protein